jgi:hypothetical protein
MLLAGLMLSGSAGSAQVPSPLHLDHAEYTATCIERPGNTCSYGFTLVARYENRTADTLYVSRCYPSDPTPVYGVETIEDTAEDAAYDPVWACVGHDFPIVIAPHAARVDTLRIEGPNSYDGKTNAPMGRFDGEFRLLYQVSSCWAGRTKCQLLPEWQRSGTFRVHLVR